VQAYSAIHPDLQENSVASSYLASSGMTPAHFEVFRRVAQEHPAILVVRNTNMKSTQWILRGYPAKPQKIKLKTDDETGKVTAKDAAEKKTALELNYYVIDNDGVARNRSNQALPGKFNLGKPAVYKPGEVIDPYKKLSLVGDYDLQGVIDPKAPGRIIGLVASNGEWVKSITNTEVEAVRAKLNAGFDQPRVMHGSEDLFKSFNGAATAFLTDGSVLELASEAAVKQFYASLGRQTSDGSYRPEGVDTTPPKGPFIPRIV